MRIPISWLGEYVELESEDPADVLAKLVRVGLEEEDIHPAEVSGPVVVGQVLSRQPEPQTNGKTINWCQVRVAPEGTVAADGGGDVRGIVCGAHNFEVGDKVVVTLPGSVLPGDFRISARKTYGHLSDGMMASARELGLGEDHTGIIVLSRLGLDPEVGADARRLLHLDEQAIEINVTPDRGYCFSIRGVAREYSHSTGARFTDPASLVDTADGRGFSVTVDDPAPVRGNPAVRGFVTRVVRGVDPSRPTPPWMARRLQLAGMRSISVVVDITNYVMLELGNPLHAYDFARVSGGIVVRRGRSGEHLTTLDGQDRLLSTEDLVIADHSDAAIGLAGVMGGEDTEVTGSTRDVLIESAVFDPISIARTARRHKLPSEASKRFERGVDPEVSAAAAQRAVDLLVEFAGGTASDLGSTITPIDDRSPIELPLDFPSHIIGVDYSSEQVIGTLRAIGCSVQRTEDSLEVLAPTWRPDLRVDVDLVEEVARIVGYDLIPTRLPVAPPGHGFTFAQRARRRVSDSLADAGMTEVWSYPFVSGEQNARFTRTPEKELRQVRLANPLDAKAPFLRRDLLPGLLDVAKRNASRGITDVAIMERGVVFRPTGDEGRVDPLPRGAALPAPEILQALQDTIPDQPLHIAGLYAGFSVPKQPGVAAERVDWRKGVEFVRQVGHSLGLRLGVRQAVLPGFHPGRGAEVVLSTAAGTRVVGVAGALHPDVVSAADLHGEVAAAELDLDALIAAAPRVGQAHALSTMPAATQDLSLVVPIDTVAGDVLDAVREGAGELLESALLTDDYRGPGIPEQTKSLTFALRFRASERTLTAAEASASRDAAAHAAQERFGATVRA